MLRTFSKEIPRDINHDWRYGYVSLASYHLVIVNLIQKYNLILDSLILKHTYITNKAGGGRDCCAIDISMSWTIRLITKIAFR